MEYEKEARFAGADNRTPSIPQYFSWINSTNEGSTEKQTLINLDYFRYLKDTYGMQLKIYAWDAGNFDGASMGYGDPDSEKLKAQYPEGYKNVVEKAKESGIRMGIWGSPDGFGDDPETEKKRFDFFVHLCRDYHFMEFKLDGVCGQLRPEKAEIFSKMMIECRKYSPDLIVLNHRLPLYEGEKYATTFLWQGAESYTDCTCTPPSNTAMHNRSYFFKRGHSPNLMRLCEDHGVCISSSIDYFEDEMIYQAFSRSLILAPETYGNPWFLKDSEEARYAHIYNMHKRNANILVDGIELPDSLGAFPVSRGNEIKRFICTGNNSWNPKEITLYVDESIGLSKEGEYDVILRHPYNEKIASISFGDAVTLTLMPFRATLIEIALKGHSDPVIEGIAYEVIREDENGNPLEYKILNDGKADIREKAPLFLGTFGKAESKNEDDEFLYETAMFAVSNDSLEAQSLARAGKTLISEVQKARDAFFNQKVYVLRGCENKALFDKNEDTFFDSQSRCYCDTDLRIEKGCLRVDMGVSADVDYIEIISFSPDSPTREIPKALTPLYGSYSDDLKSWRETGKAELSKACDYTQKTVKFTVHTVYDCKGYKMRSVYPIGSKMRYFRLSEPMDRIYSFKAFKDGKEVVFKNPFANNMMASYDKKPSKFIKTLSFTLPEYKKGSYLAVAVEGKHGVEGVYGALKAENVYYGFNRRSPAYKANQWEHRVLSTDGFNTLFFDLPDDLSGKLITVTLLFNGTADENVVCNAYLCDKHE